MFRLEKSIILHILNASGKFNSFDKNIVEVVGDSLEKIESTIPISNIDIVIYDDPWATIKKKGISGNSRGAHMIFIPLDLTFNNIKRVIDREIPRTLAHEIHHVVRYREIGQRKTLLDGLVAEGLAGHFEIELFGGKPAFWYRTLKKEELIKFIKLFEKHYYEEYDLLKWFFGKGRKIPKWAGYTIGFTLVDKYLQKHPKKKPSDLYKTASKEFI